MYDGSLMIEDERASPVKQTSSYLRLSFPNGMNEATDYDGAWKEALDLYWRPFVELCFPEVARRIDWSAPVEFLDKELQEIVRDADLGKQRVDKLVKVRRLDGTEEWVLVHVEVQAQPDEGLPQRVYQYHHRIVDRFGRRVVTLVVLADERAGWCPATYEEELWGCRVTPRSRPAAGPCPRHPREYGVAEKVQMADHPQALRAGLQP